MIQGTTLMLMWRLGSRLGSTKNSSVRIAILGIVLGTALLSATLMVVRGYENALLQKLLHLGPHMELSAHYGLIQDWESLVTELETNQQVVAAHPSFSYSAAIRSAGKLRPLQIQSATKPNTSGESSGLGLRLVPNKRDIILGDDLVLDMKLSVGDYVEFLILAPHDELGRRVMRRKFKLAGVFDSGTNMDRSIGIIGYQAAAAIVGATEKQAATVEITLDKPIDAYDFYRKVQAEYAPRGLSILTWEDHHSGLFAAIELSRQILTVLLLSIILVAAFNVVGTMLIVLEQRRYELARLLMMGGSSSLLVGAMLARGLYLGLIGGILGLVAGWALAISIDPLIRFMGEVYGVELLNTEVYFLSQLPASAEIIDMLVVMGSTITVCILASAYPAFRVSRLRPTQAMADRALL
jgi:lipoprotein-releasing system permease protein